MRTFDLAPLYRATVGFDRLADVMDRVMSDNVAANTYPPYNIEKTADDAWRISIAVAGFTDAELNVEVRENALIVSARKADEDGERKFLHRGIATRAFERRFTLAEHVRVTGAAHVNGMLHIDLVREVPEALKPRTIEIAQRRHRRGEGGREASRLTPVRRSNRGACGEPRAPFACAGNRAGQGRVRTTSPETGSVTPRSPPRSSSMPRMASRVETIAGRAATSASMLSHSPMTTKSRSPVLTTLNDRIPGKLVLLAARCAARKSSLRPGFTRIRTTL